MSRRSEIQDLIRKHQRRLQKLREKEATLGISTPPEISTEIEDIEVKIDELQIELQNIRESQKFSSTTPSSVERSRGVYRFKKYLFWTLGGMAVAIVLFSTLYLVRQSREQGTAPLTVKTTTSQLVSDTCFEEFFANLPDDRIIALETGAAITLISPNQSKEEMIGIQFTEMHQPIGAIKIFPFPKNKMFKIGEIIDAECQGVENFENVTHGGDKYMLRNADTVQMQLNDKHYALRINFYGGTEIRGNFLQFIP